LSLTQKLDKKGGFAKVSQTNDPHEMVLLKFHGGKQKDRSNKKKWQKRL